MDRKIKKLRYPENEYRPAKPTDSIVRDIAYDFWLSPDKRVLPVTYTLKRFKDGSLEPTMSFSFDGNTPLKYGIGRSERGLP